MMRYAVYGFFQAVVAYTAGSDFVIRLTFNARKGLAVIYRLRR